MDINSVGRINDLNTVEYRENSQRSVKQIDNKTPVTEQKKDQDLKTINSAVDKANKVLFKNNTHLKFQVHEGTKDIMVKIVDDVTGDVLKEIPSEKMLDMVAKLWEIAGIFVDEKR